MSQYGTIYRLNWNTVPSVLSVSTTIPAQAMQVSIYDTDHIIEDSEIPTIIQLQADANPLVIKIINNDEDKFSPVRAKQALIQFRSSLVQFQDATTFADSRDFRWKVEATADGEYVFIGFLVLADIQQDHLPDPNLVTLAASDMLGLLKTKVWQTDTGDNPIGKYRIANIIALCLKRTGLRLNITAINNLRHGTGSMTTTVNFDGSNNTMQMSNIDAQFFYKGQKITVSGTAANDGDYIVVNIASGIISFVELNQTLTTEAGVSATFQDGSSDGHFYDQIFLDARTFEQAIGESEDCYTVLEKILGEDCFLTQWKGSWYIMRIDEYDGNPIYPCTFDADGDNPVFDTPTTFAKSVGASETRKLANADNLRRYDMQHEYVKETVNLESPEELICNEDYARGDVSADPDKQRSGYTAYDLDSWETGRLWGSALAPANFKSSIQRSFNQFGDEEQRFIMLTKPASPTGSFEYIRPCAVPMSYRDKFRFTFEASALQDTSGDGSILVCIILLYGVDGSVWILRASDLNLAWDNTDGDVETQWKLTDEEVSLFRDGMQWSIFDDADHPPKTDWVQFSMNAAPLPVDGDVYCHLFSANQFSGTFDDFDIKYQNIELEYRPYIGGHYEKYKKFHHKVTRDPSGYFSTRRDREVFIFDSPKPIFKGAMFFFNGSGYALTQRWWTSAPFGLGPPPSLDHFHSYGYIQAFSVWNQYRNANRIFTTSVLGLGSMWPDAVDKYSLTDSHPDTNNRFFLLISFEQNWKTALWSGIFIEDYRTDVPKNYDDTHELKFTT